MVRSLAHRGPDDSGVAVVGNVGLIHTRLAIVDPTPAGHQPMLDDSGQWAIIYNGEIFNHRELREELPPLSYRGGSDTETLLHGLICSGESFIQRCNGLYAFAALDRRQGRLLLVRDRFGVKPLYFARHRGALWFASEIGALLAAGIPRRPCMDIVRHVLATGWVNGDETPIDGVRRVLPGTMVEVDLASLNVSSRTWYDPADAVDPELVAELANIDRAAAVEMVEAALRTAVRRRLMADVPVGTMCSGGIDSSLVAKFARDEQPAIHAFNASVSDQPDVDEASWAELVANHIGIELHTVRMTAETWRAELVDVVRHIEYPLVHESSVPMSQIARLARSRGVKVLLSGEGADELFGGYPWRHARDYADFAARHQPLHRRSIRALRSTYRRRQRVRGTGSALDGAGAGPAQGPVEFERAVGDRALRAYAMASGPRRRLAAGLLADLGTYLPHLLNRQDKSTMRCSIETRVPFLDPDLVRLVINMPLEHRVEAQRKGVLRDLTVRHLPPSIAERPKVGFGFDILSYVDGALRPEFLNDGSLRELLGVSSAEWPAETHRAFTALTALTMEIWCRLMLDGSSVESVERELWR